MPHAIPNLQAVLFAEENGETQQDSAAEIPNSAFEPATPAMAQYLELKNANADCLLFYRMGDFYEMFFQDAEIASRALGIALTKRGKHKGEDIPMAGVPVHAADDYLQKLIGLGHRVAVAEQMEDPAEAKKRGAKSVVRRDVVRLVTPGTITEEKLLDGASHSYLAALARTSDEGFGFARLDLSCGEFVIGTTTLDDLASDIARIAPKEILLPDDLYHDKAVRAAINEKIALTPLASTLADSSASARKLAAFFQVGTLESFGRFTRPELSAAGLVLAYIERTQRDAVPRLSVPKREQRGSFVEIDPAARASLELTQTLSGEKKGALLSVIDMTLTQSGSRLLCHQLTMPLTDVVAITLRHDAVEALFKNMTARKNLRAALREIPDMSRALSRLALQRGGPRDLGHVRTGLKGAATLLETLRAAPDLNIACLATIRDGLGATPLDLLNSLNAALVDDLPHLQRDGGFVRNGYLPELDAQRRFRDDAQQLIIGLQQKYISETGIKGLKIKHNNMLGYFIETGAQFSDAMRSAPLNGIFIHRQTLASQSRFSTNELSDIQAQIFGAADKAQKLEDDVFADLRSAILGVHENLTTVCDAIAALDVTAALAELAQDQHLVRPTIDDSLAFSIEGGRHIVVEQALRESSAPPFIANGCDLSNGAIWLLTGPNMAGKSTFLRQNALIAILAQMGSFVPAKAAHIGVIDRLYSRVGAADDLARGRSTFMVEMVETASILHQATTRSLVILDEIGRGTATFDGLSIAWASVEHLHEANTCRALFATHFHELTALEQSLPRLRNMSMQVKEWQGDLVFLHTIGAGVADGSYGLQVAKLAGLPAPVIARASAVLAQLEAQETQTAPTINDMPRYEPAVPLPQTNLLQEMVDALEPDALTPREALDALYKIKQLGNANKRAATGKI